QKKCILKEFNEILNSKNEYIFEQEKLDFKSKYTFDYFNFYDDLNLEEQINEFNDGIINQKKQEILNSLPDEYISYSQMKEYQMKNDYQFELDKIIEEHNNDFIEKHILDNDFFDNVAGRSLDNNQRIAVLTDDDNNQIVAGAGTGKTLTIQAKVKYLIEKQGIKPEDILCISFSNSARDDLAEKLKRTIDAPVEVRTFHSLGYSILGINGYDREVPKYELNNLIDSYFKEDYVKKPKEVIEFFSYYFNLIHINEDELKLETIKSKLNSLDEYDEYLQEYLQIHNFKQKKEYMHSIQELIIANYLFIHNINYIDGEQLIFKNEYLDNQVNSLIKYLFLKDSDVIPEEIKQKFAEEVLVNFEDDFGYKKCELYPKFYLPDYDVYIDLDRVNHDWQEYLPDESKGKVINKLELRNELNKSYKTKLITLFDYDDNVELLIENLQNNLLNYNVSVNEANWDKLFELLVLKDNLPEYKIFIDTIERFINLFKGNAKNINFDGEDISKKMFIQYLDENKKLYSSSIEKRNKFFLNIIETVYKLYAEDLEDNDYIDFNDMINDAVVELRHGAKIHNYKYVIVDEYQDTSHTRYNLLKEIQNATGAKIVVVGDDWQSIYGFTGCDVNLFSKFDEYFENPKRVIIDITRRNSQELINVVGEFIKKNKNQIPKKLKSDKFNDSPIKIFEYNTRAEEVLAFITILDEISDKNEDAKILVLGRNNRDINEVLCKEIFSTIEFNDYTKITYEQNKKLNIQFRTVHKSKGLEADYVFVLNLNNQINGFPNKIVNDPILNFVNNIQDENIEYPEERRLFYVALTRTKNDVYLFNRVVRPSLFINQIKNKPGVEKLKYIFSNEDIMAISSLLQKKFEVIETGLTCPDCEVGNVNLIVNNERGTSYFKCSNFCGWNGGPHHNNSSGFQSRKISYVQYAEVCPDCGGMLIVKNGEYGYFLGCNFYRRDGLGCNCTKNLPFNFEKTHETINNVFIYSNNDKFNRTRNGVYYLNEYVPEDKREDYNQEHVDFSEKLLNYKNDSDDYSLNFFTKALMNFISKLFKSNEDNMKLALISVPSSKIYKNKSSIKKSINLIEKWYEMDRLNSEFNCKKEIINYKDLLKRIKDVPTAHLGEGRASCEQHIDSIECIEKNLSNDNIAYIVLDDITTTGNSMRACNEILLESGVNDENIYNIAIGATVRDDDEEI
ncbi:MAG: UvrD-helicase domain-containing protein, partial [Methanobrevibacter sp.]|uniref:UvrD-helicase domain-containing protein n=1 Tax=Methanobrevibacter sp. TaxID=66852 RepID=UPI002E783CE7